MFAPNYFSWELKIPSETCALICSSDELQETAERWNVRSLHLPSFNTQECVSLCNDTASRILTMHQMPIFKEPQGGFSTYSSGWSRHCLLQHLWNSILKWFPRPGAHSFQNLHSWQIVSLWECAEVVWGSSQYPVEPNLKKGCDEGG